MSSSVVLIHWNDQEAVERLKRLRSAGFTAEHLNPQGGSKDLRSLATSPPAAVLIDLGRLPSHGRAVGVALRGQKATRHVPLVFVDGAAEKVDATRALLPDASYTTWGRIKATLRRRIGTTIEKPVVPGTMAGYSGTPLPKKLGIKQGSTVLLMHAPGTFEMTLGALPESVTITRSTRQATDLVLLFARGKATLLSSLSRAVRVMRDGGSVWVLWPKKASGVKSDLSERIVRETGLANGLVDFKVCAVDETWAGLRFARRKK